MKGWKTDCVAERLTHVGELSSYTRHGVQKKCTSVVRSCLFLRSERICDNARASPGLREAMHAAVTKEEVQPVLRLKRQKHGLGCGKLPRVVILVFKWLVGELYRQTVAGVCMEAA